MNDPQSLSRRAIRSAGWAVGGGYASQALAFVLFLIISRMVGPEAFGAVAVAIALVELGRALVTESVAATLIARGAFERGAYNAGFVWSMGGAILLYIVMLAAAPFLASLFQTPALGALIPQIGILLLFYGASRLQEARLVQEMRFQSLALRAVLAALIGGGVGVVAAHAGMGVHALVLQQWASAATSLVLIWGACAWRPGLDFTRQQFLDLHRASLMLTPANLLTNASVVIDGLAAAAFGGPAAAGIYNLGKRVRLAMQMALSSGLERVSLPTFASLRADPAALAAALRDGLRLSMLIAFPIFFGLAAISPDLVQVFLGPAWAGAAAPMALLLIGGALALATNYCENTLLVLERRRWIVALRGVLLAVLLAGLIAVGRHGPDFIAAAALAAAGAHHLAALAAVARATPLSMRAYAAAVAAPFCIALTMFVLLVAIRQTIELHLFSALPRMLLQIFIGAVFYVGAAALVARSSVRAIMRAARAAL